MQQWFVNNLATLCMLVGIVIKMWVDVRRIEDRMKNAAEWQADHDTLDTNRFGEVRTTHEKINEKLGTQATALASIVTAMDYLKAGIDRLNQQNDVRRQ